MASPRRAASSQLTLEECVLRAFKDFRGDQTISNLGREIGLSVAATSQLVERLVQDDLVRRTEHPSDRRRKPIVFAETIPATTTRPA